MIQFIRHTHPIHRTIRTKIERITHSATFITLLAYAGLIFEETSRTSFQTAAILSCWSKSCIGESKECCVIVAFSAIC